MIHDKTLDHNSKGLSYNFPRFSCVMICLSTPSGMGRPFYHKLLKLVIKIRKMTKHRQVFNKNMQIFQMYAVTDVHPRQRERLEIIFL